MFPFGVTYYPDQWPQDTWDETFHQIRKAGFNIVRFGEMAWDWIEPQAGKFSFSELDHAMDLCAKHGLKVLLGVPTSQVPTWFFTKYPNSQPVAQDGTKYPSYGPRPNICKDNPNYQKLAERLAKKMVARYKNHPALKTWQVDNEPLYPPLDHTTSNDYCHCEHSRQAFIAWAKKRYGSLKRLNRVWGAKFWTNSFSSWEDIQTPKAGIWEAVSPHIFLDWYRFKTERIRDWVSHLAKIVRSIDKNHTVGTNGFVGIVSRVPDHSIIPENIDWYGLDIYPIGGKMSEEQYALTLDLWRSFTHNSKAEFHITELQGGQNVRWGYPGHVDGSEFKGWIDTAINHGCQAILFHAWRPPLFGAETNGFGILKADGSSSTRLEAIKKISSTIRHLPAGRQGSSCGIAIAFLRNSEVQTYQEQGPPRGISGQWEAVRADIGLTHSLDSIAGAYKTIYKKDQSVDFIFDQDLESGKLPYKVILLPNPYLLSMKQYNNLKKWVSNGGLLITEARFGLKDENGHLYQKPLMEDLLGVSYEYTIPTEKGFFDGLNKTANKEQIIEKKIGKGKVVYANFSLFLQIRNNNKKWLSFVKKFI